MKQSAELRRKISEFKQLKSVGQTPREKRTVWRGGPTVEVLQESLPEVWATHVQGKMKLTRELLKG